MKCRLLLLVSIGVIISGCATATRGKPAGARAISNIPNKTKNSNLDGFYGCEPTPCGINFSRSGSPDLLKRIPIGGASIFGGVMTLGAGSIVDGATGAGLSLSPNPVTVFLAPAEVTRP